MKKNQLCLTLIWKLFILTSVILTLEIQTVRAQQVPLADSSKKYDEKYYRKYRTNKSIAWVSASTGLIALAIGISEPYPKYYINSDPTLGFPKRKGQGLRIAGCILGIGSIPLFINAHRNKRKALISLKEQNVNVFGNRRYNINYIALAFKIIL